MKNKINRKLSVLLTAVTFCLSISSMNAKDIYVTSSGNDNNLGTQTSPYKTFGKALSVVDDNDVIHIIDMLNMQDEATGTGVGQMENGNGGILFPTGKTNVTVQGKTRTASGFQGIKNKGVRFFLLSGANGFKFNNLTFTNGLFGIDAASPDGGPIYIKNSITSFESCDFTMNGYTKTTYGGALRIENSTVAVLDCKFENNYSPNGGAIYIEGGKLTVENSSFEKGQSSLGGAIFTNVKGENPQNVGEKEVEILCKNSHFSSNKSGMGGAVCVSNTVASKAANIRFESCSFSENTGQGGAVYLQNKQTGLNSYSFVNSTFYRNKTTTNGGAFLLFAGQVGETFDLINCTVLENYTEGNSGHGGGIRFYAENVETGLHSAQNVTKRILNCVIEGNYATNGGSGSSSSDLSIRYTPTLSDLVMKNSFVGVDGNSTINLGDYMHDNMINYYAAVRSLAKMPENTGDVFNEHKSVGVSEKSIASMYGDATYLQQLGITTDQQGNVRPFTDNLCSIGAVEVTPDVENGDGGVSGEPVYSSYKGLVMTGYQGWFTVKGDESGTNAYTHTGKDGKFEPGYAGIEFWPDMREYTKQYPVNFKHSDGSQAYFYSSSDEETVDLHFKWMQENNIDGVFVQRFISSITRDAIGKVLGHVVKAAKKYNRSFSIMYDLSGLGDDPEDALANKVYNDWKILNTAYRFTDPSVCPTFLHHNGKPMVALWGIGIGGNANVAGFEKIMDRLEDLDGQTGKLSYLLGSAYYWRAGGGDAASNTAELRRVLKKGDIISPWAVGRYGSLSEYEQRVKNNLQPDIQWCKDNGVDYAPVVFPGFSWRNLKGLSVSSYDQIPRLKGDFLWRQLAQAKQSGAEMIYVAMFDELDEGTAIFKCANTKDVPVYATSADPQGRFLGIDDELPTDYYLFLSGEAGRWLKGEVTHGDQKPDYMSSIATDQIDAEFPLDVIYQNSVLAVEAYACGETFVNVYSASGECAFRLKNGDLSIPFNQSVDLRNLPKGVYVINVQFENQTKNFKIIR